jgi:F420-non-reducing hydrogenase iron-sulfur subunit
MKEEFDPRIVYILCSWCGTGGAETAASHHLHYPENVNIYRVNCTGALPTVHLFRSLIEGADGVAVSGCHPGDCHYNDGNFRARRRVALVKSILKSLGLGDDRIWFRYVAHGEGRRFVDTAESFNEHIRNLGPNELRRRTDT